MVLFNYTFTGSHVFQRALPVSEQVYGAAVLESRGHAQLRVRDGVRPLRHASQGGSIARHALDAGDSIRQLADSPLHTLMWHHIARIGHREAEREMGARAANCVRSKSRHVGF
jgi:hypothetical protein